MFGFYMPIYEVIFYGIPLKIAVLVFVGEKHKDKRNQTELGKKCF